MTRLAEHLDKYLTIRRALGFKLINDGRMLNDFVAFANAAGEDNSRSGKTPIDLSSFPIRYTKDRS